MILRWGLLLALASAVLTPYGRLLLRAEYMAGLRDYTPIKALKFGIGIRL